MWKVTVAAALLLAVPGAQACQVVPLVDLEFPEKPACRGAEDCDPVPGHGESLRYDGVLHWRWDVDQCTVENGMPGGEVTVHLGQTLSTPDWMRMRPDPEKVVIKTEEQADPRNLHVEDPTGNAKVYFQVDKPIAVTFTRVGAPDAEDTARLEARDGTLPMFLKAESTSSTMAMTSFGVEEFRFDAAALLEGGREGRPADAGDASTPWPLPVTALALIGAALAARRR